MDDTHDLTSSFSTVTLLFVKFQKLDISAEYLTRQLSIDHNTKVSLYNV